MSEADVTAADELVTGWVDSALRVPASAFVPIDDLARTGKIAAASRQWSARFFAPAANPHLVTPKPRWSVHLATPTSFDLLRHAYDVGATRLDVLEARSFTLVRALGAAAPILALPDGDHLAAVNALAASILRVRGDEHAWTFDAASPLADGARFTTDRAVDPLSMPSWTSRADGGIRGGDVFFLLYKRIPEILGYFANAEWLDDATRSALQP